MNSLTKEQAKYLADRVDENNTGRILVPSRLIKKYREFTGDYESGGVVIKEKIKDSVLKGDWI